MLLADAVELSLSADDRRGVESSLVNDTLQHCKMRTAVASLLCCRAYPGVVPASLNPKVGLAFCSCFPGRSQSEIGFFSFVGG